MGRPKRQCAGGIAYHALNRANGKLRIFRKHADFEAFEHILAQALAKFPMRLCGYCIMGNHWHMLLWPRNDGDISEFVRWVTLTHTQRWHASHGTAGTGHLYQGRFKSFPVQSDSHYLKTMQYIESNPLRAGLVENSCDWQYSSLAVRNGTARDAPIVNPGPVKLPTNWNRYVNIAPNKKDSLTLENCIKRGTPYGGDRWIAAISNKLGLQITLRPRGRPKKGSPCGAS